MLWATVSWLLCLREMLLAQSRKLLATVIPFPVSSPPSTTACSPWRAQKGVPTPLLQGEGTIFKPACMPGKWSHCSCWWASCSFHDSTSCPHHLSLQKKTTTLILSCTTSSEKTGKWSAEMGNSTGFLGLLNQIPFPLPLLPSVAINAYDGWATVFSQIAAAGRQHTLLNDSPKN